MPIRKSSISGASIPGGTTADRPASPAIGDQFYNGTLGVLEIYTTSGWLPATGANDFNIVLTGSETSVTLDKEYFAGAYTIGSSLNDTTFDIYLFDTNNGSAGYTKSPSINATSNFNKVFIYGGTSGDLLTFSYKTTFTTLQTTADNSIMPPYVSAVSAADLPNPDDSVTITGGNFDTDVQIWFDGQNGYSQQAKSVVYGSSTSVVAVRPDSFLEDNAPYTVRAINPGTTEPTGSGKNKLTNAITAGGDPVWTTAADTEFGFAPGIAMSHFVSASDPDGSQITYSAVSGLPSGISINSSTGEISGTTASTVGGQFIISATDASNNVTNRSFILQNLAGTSSAYPAAYPSDLTIAGHTASGDYWLIGNGSTPYQVYCYYDGSSFWARTAMIPRGSGIGFDGYRNTVGTNFSSSNVATFSNLQGNVFGNSGGTNLEVMLRVVGGSFSGAVANTPGRKTKTIWRGVDLGWALNGSLTNTLSSAGSEYSNDGGSTWTAFSGGSFSHANAQWNWIISTTDGNSGAYNNSTINGWLLHGSGDETASLIYAYMDNGVQLSGDASWTRAELYIRI